MSVSCTLVLSNSQLFIDANVGSPSDEFSPLIVTFILSFITSNFSYSALTDMLNRKVTRPSVSTKRMRTKRGYHVVGDFYYY